VSDLRDQTEVATGYEDLLVPALFGQWADIVLDAAQVRGSDRVLDVACGTGVLARQAVERVGPTGAIGGIDPAPGMLAVAGRLAPTVAWRQGTAESLPYADHSFDAVVSQFGLMFFADRRKALREMVRVLAPQGRLAVAVWDSLENIPAYAAEVALLDRIAGARAADALRAPFVLGSPKDLVTLFKGADIPSVAIATHTGTARFPSITTMVEADLRGWLPVMGVILSEEQIQRILAEAESDLGHYVTGEGNVEFALSAHVITGSKP
jgi:SAM-dependent methyltransferase